jgi:hypothetical protein
MKIDREMLSRLLIGALTEHEQRMLVVRLLRLDPQLRLQLVSLLEPFEVFDADLACEYEALLDQLSSADDGGAELGEELAERHREILGRAFARAPDLERLISDFTYRDLLQLGEVTRKLFSWSMAELLLRRGRDPDLDDRRARTSLYLAAMVIDVVEILGVAGHSPHCPRLIADVRRRVYATRDRLVSV